MGQNGAGKARFFGLIKGELSRKKAMSRAPTRDYRRASQTVARVD